jgi:hypothetical protein
VYSFWALLVLVCFYYIGKLLFFFEMIIYLKQFYILSLTLNHVKQPIPAGNVLAVQQHSAKPTIAEAIDDGDQSTV